LSMSPAAQPNRTRPSSPNQFTVLILATSLGLALANSSAAITNDQPAPRGQNYAFLVSCADYEKKELRPLKYTQNDIAELYQALLDAGFRQQNIVVMHDQQERRLQPEAKHIRRHLNLLLARVGRQDSLIVALAGHGVQFRGETKSFFCPVDAELTDRSTLISLDEIYQQLDRCQAQRKLLLVDACRNDPQSELSRSRAEVELESVTRPQDETVPGGIVALFSCSAGQRSFEYPDLKHGIFFYHVLEALKGAADANGDGKVTLDELTAYAKQNTQAFAHLKLESRQIPQQKGEFSGVWVLREINLPEMKFKEGINEMNKHDFNRAIAAFDECIRLDPHQLSDEPYLWRGHTYHNRGYDGDLDRAIADYTEAIRHNPKTRAYGGRGMAYNQKGNYNRAIADLTAAIRIHPEDWVSQFQRGNSYYSKRSYDRAIMDYNKAILLNPKYAISYSNRGNAYSAKGDYDRAVADLSLAIQLDPKEGLFYSNRAAAYEGRGDNDLAEADRETAKRLTSEK
jgi:tetratricopeptide (TPR) repeat protein